MYFYNARYYDPSLGRFLSADTIVPSPANPQSYNRYAYTLNNPLKYADPSGHVHFLVTAAIGGIAGAAISIGTQMWGAWQSGGATNLGEAWQSVDMSKVAVAAVGGAVAGGTMGLVSPAVMGTVMPGVALKFGEASLVTHLTGLGISVGAGGLAGIAGGQAEALTEGVIAEGVNSRTGNGTWSLRGAWNEARNSGLGDVNAVQKDAIVGGIAGGIGFEVGAIKSAIGLAPQPQWRVQVHPDRINYARQFLSPQLRRYLLAMEAIDQFAGEKIENILAIPSPKMRSL